MSHYRVLLADDHVMVRKGLRATIEEHEGWQVCGEAGTGREAVALARELNPDIVVMDFAMPELNGMEATRQIKAASAHVEVLVLTMHESERLVREIIEAGARGYLLKTDAGTALMEALRVLAEHKPYFTSKAASVVLQGFLNPEMRKDPELTPREREIIQLIAEGKSTKTVADILGISVKTAETHRTNLMRKLDLHSTADVVRYAVRNQIIEP